MAVKKAFLGLWLLILGPSSCFAASIGVNQFSGLDSQDPPNALQPSQSQDLLNVRLQPGGRSVFKRDGYGLFQMLNAVSTATVHGGYHFQQAGGSDVQLWGSDNGLFASVNDTAFVRVATATVGVTWQCTDNLGFAYCVTSSGVDTPVKTDGTLANTTYQGSIPSGTMIASTPLQLVVAGVPASPSTIYVSANNNFTNFTVGPLPTDSYTEIINSPGSRLTHLGYYFGNIYWWKDQSLGYMSGSAAAANVGITIISNQIGTLDNSSAFWNPTTYDAGNKFNSGAQTVSSGNPYFNEMASLGGVFFRGQDGHFYQYDGYSLSRLSRIITPNITGSNRRKANSWTQTSQSNFNTGISSQIFALSTSISPGDIVLSTNQFVDTSWSLGTLIQLDTTTMAPSVILSSFSTTSSPANQSNQSNITLGVCYSYIGNLAQAFTTDGNAQQIISGGFRGIGGGSSPGCASTYRIKTNNSGTPGTDVVTAAVAAFPVSDGPNTVNFTPTTLTPNTTYWLWMDQCGSVNSYNDVDYSNPNSYTHPNYGPGNAAVCNGFGYADIFQINVQGVQSFQYFSTGSVTSRLFDITLTSNTFYGGATYYAYLQTNETDNNQSISYGYQTSTGTSGSGPYVWTSSITISTNTSFGPLTSRYYRYVAQLNSSNPSLTPVLSTVTTNLKISTGTYYSAVDNAPNLSTWGSFTASDLNTGISSITYYTRASTNSFTVLSSTPAWVGQTKNAMVTASTGTYMQMRGDFYLSAATETPTLNDFTFNWFEGTASDKAYINYFQDAILFAVSSGSTTATNNALFYLDLLNNTWLRDDIASNGLVIENNALYIGSPLTAKIYKFGGVTTDNSLPIHSYWKSMDFTGQDPTVQNSWDQADFAFGEASNTVTFTYTVDQSTGTFLKQVPLSLYSPVHSIVKRGFALANGEIGTYYNFKIEDNSSLPPWTLMGQRTSYSPLPWRPQLSL